MTFVRSHFHKTDDIHNNIYNWVFHAAAGKISNNRQTIGWRCGKAIGFSRNLSVDSRGRHFSARSLVCSASRLFSEAFRIITNAHAHNMLSYAAEETQSVAL